MSVITVHTREAYSIRIERGLLPRLEQALSEVFPSCRIALLTDDTTGALYGDPAAAALSESGYAVTRITVPHGEESKSWQTLGHVLEELAAAELTRADALLALGGGMIGDLGGLAAALYRRGIACVQVPTTLLAAVDASVGGKTAVDLAAGKNLAGIIRQPTAVLCDPDLLDALPAPLLRDGMAEIIKMGVLGAEGVWGELTEKSPDLAALTAACTAYKAALVEQDEGDCGIRRALNLGHTFGHAIERRSGYTLSHGQSVAIGLAMMTRAARERGWCDSITAERILTALRRHSLPVKSPYPPEELLPFALADKKRLGDSIVIVIPNQIGYCTLRSVSPRELEELLRLGY